MNNLLCLPHGHLQRFYEVYRSEHGLYPVAERLQEELNGSLPEIEKLPVFTIQECE